MGTTLRNDQSINEHYTVIDVPYGKMLINAHDPLLPSNLQENVREINALMQFAKGVVIDVGANVGSHAINFSKVAEVVYAFEPHPLTYRNLCANLLLNLVYNTDAINKALGSYNGWTSVACMDPTTPGTPMGTQVGNGSHPVEICTLDSMNISPVHFIKIDTEGYELEVLKGAVDTLYRENPIVYVEIHSKDLVGPVDQYMKNLGYQTAEYITVVMHNEEQEDVWLTTGHLFWKVGRIQWVQEPLSQELQVKTEAISQNIF